MSDHSDIFKQIQTLCDEFRRQLRQGVECRIEEYVGRVPKSAQASLFSQLLAVEVTTHQRRGKQPKSADYIDRFPQFAKQVRQVFLEPSLASRDTPVNAPTIEPTFIAELPLGEQLGDYELLRELGRGAFGIVYEARHVRRNDRVALKTLKLKGELDADRLHRFRHEFRRLAETNHPHLVGMQTLEYDARTNQWFFTMELVNGTDFLQHVRPHGALDEQRLRSVLPQLVEGISGLHTQKIVHRDLKPSNVMVDGNGRLVILDFGLVAELQERLEDTVSLRSVGQFAGTLRYAAPEQLDGRRPAAADWYAMGVMIYEALTGQAPFDGSMADLMVQKKTLDAPQLAGRKDVPADLAALVDQLLSRDPNGRPSETEIASTLSGTTSSEAGPDDPDLAPSAALAEVTLIGRETQLAQLEEARKEWDSGEQPVVVFVSGKSGEGKTALIEHFLEPLRHASHILVLSGKCYDRESVPYKAIDGLIDALVGYLRSRSDEEVAGLLPEDTGMLAELFPVMRRVAEIAKLDLTLVKRLDAKQVRFRAFNALKELLARISRDTQLVMFIDDLQWGDADSAGELVRLLSPDDPPTVLVVGSFRSDEVDESSFLKQWSVLSTQKRAGNSRDELSTTPFSQYDAFVGPLSPGECEQLAVSRIGRDSPAIRNRACEIHRSTAGNPYLIDQLIECLDADTGVVTPSPLEEVIAGRLSRLPAEATRLLEVVAISGHSISATEAAEAAGLSGSGFGVLNRMRNERLVRLIGSDHSCLVDTYHDKIRDTVLDQMEDLQCKGLHKRLAEVIEAQDQVDGNRLFAMVTEDSARLDGQQASPVRVYDLAYHFDAGGVGNKAFAYSLLAAEQALSRFALDVASENFEISRRHAALASQASRYRLTLGYGQTLVLAGRFQQATDVLNDAFQLATSDLELARIEAIQAEIAYKGGSITKSIEIYERALRRLGVRVPSTYVGLFASYFQLELRRLGLKLVPDRWRTSHATRNEERLLRFQVLYRANYPYHFRDTLRQSWIVANALSAGENSAVIPCQARGNYVWGSVLSSNFGRYSKGSRYLDQANELARKSGDLSLEAAALRLTAYSQLATGHFEEAANNLEKTAELFEAKVPDYWQRVLSRLWLSSAYFRLGRLYESAEIASEIFEIAVQAGQDRLAQMAIDPWARATEGDLPFAELKSCIRPAPDDLTTTVQLLIAETHWLLHHGRTSEAIEVAEEAVAIVKSSWNFNLWTITSISTLAKALRKHADHLEQEGHAEHKTLRSRSLRVAGWAARLTRILKIDYPAALREYSLALAKMGRVKLGLKYARKSCRVAESQHADYEYALSLKACGDLGKKLGLGDAASQLTEAMRRLSRFDDRLGDRGLNDR